MALRDDFNSRAGTPGSYRGGAGAANAGLGGGMGGGNPGGGYGGGMTQNTGLRTGAQTAPSAYGRPGGMAMGYGQTPAAARQAAVQGILGRLQQGRVLPTSMPAQRPPVAPPVAPPVRYGMAPPMPGYMPNYPQPPLSMNTPGVMVDSSFSNFPAYQPGQPKPIQDRLSDTVYSGQNWGNPGSGSLGMGYTGGGRMGGGGGGW